MKKCPNCNANHEGATNTQDFDRKPAPGDFTICADCQSFFVFNDDMTVREPTPKDWNEMERKQPGFKTHLMATKKALQNVMIRRSQELN